MIPHYFPDISQDHVIPEHDMIFQQHYLCPISLLPSISKIFEKTTVYSNKLQHI